MSTQSDPPSGNYTALEACLLRSRLAQNTFQRPIFRLHHHGMVSFSQRVNVPVGPSGPSRATRTTSREPSSTEAVPSYPLRFVLVKPGVTKLTLISRLQLDHHGQRYRVESRLGRRIAGTEHRAVVKDRIGVWRQRAHCTRHVDDTRIRRLAKQRQHRLVNGEDTEYVGVPHGAYFIERCVAREGYLCVLTE